MTRKESIGHLITGGFWGLIRSSHNVLADGPPDALGEHPPCAIVSPAQLPQEPWDKVITVCDDANDACPLFPGGRNRRHWPTPDPADVQGDEATRLAAFHSARDSFRSRIEHACWSTPAPAERRLDAGSRYPEGDPAAEFLQPGTALLEQALKAASLGPC
jgi:hypothetical protein